MTKIFIKNQRRKRCQTSNNKTTSKETGFPFNFKKKAFLPVFPKKNNFRSENHV